MLGRGVESLSAKAAIETRLQAAIQAYWNTRASSQKKQVDAGKADAGARGEVTGGTQMRAIEGLVADVLCQAGLSRLDVRTRTALELPGYFRATKRWDLIVVSGGQLVMAMEFKSQAGKSIGNNVNNRTEEAVGSASELWTAYREERLGGGAPPPFLGYLFLLEDRDSVRRPVANKEPYFKADPAFCRPALPRPKGGGGKRQGVSYAKRYEILCRRLVLERHYNAACFVMATNAVPTVVTEPASDLSFSRFVAALRGHAVTFLGSQST